MVPTTTAMDTEENLPFNAELLVISLCLLTIMDKEELARLSGDLPMETGTSMEAMETGELEVKRFSKWELQEIPLCPTSMEPILSTTFTKELPPDSITNTAEMSFCFSCFLVYKTNLCYLLCFAQKPGISMHGRLKPLIQSN